MDVGCDGSVRMRHVGVGPGAPSVVAEEKERVVCGGGVVVGGCATVRPQLLFADGSVARQDSDSTSSDDLEWTLLESACVKDAATGARVWMNGATSSRSSRTAWSSPSTRTGRLLGRASTTSSSNARAWPPWRSIRISTRRRPPMPRGIKWPSRKAARRIRCRVALPDGSRVVATYDTSVTATVRGRLALLRPDRTEILAQDDGLITLRPPRGGIQGGSVKARGEHHPYGSLAPWCEAHDDDESDGEAKSEPDTAAGAYRFDCVLVVCLWRTRIQHIRRAPVREAGGRRGSGIGRGVRGRQGRGGRQLARGAAVLLHWEGRVCD